MATDTINSNDTQTCSESYDDLLRISGTNCTPSVWAQSFTYDSFGNITKSGSITWNPGYDLTNNNRYKTPQTGIIYDARGGLTSDTFHTYSYDVDGRPLSVDTISATYDALGREVEITSGSTHNQVLYSALGKTAIMTGQTRKIFWVPLVAGARAVYDSGMGFHYQHPDWLGSARVGSSGTKTKVFDRAFAPFGELYANSGSPNGLNFTGQTQDTGASNTYDFPARQYNPNQGRWLIPDPSGYAVNESNPQSWNRYAYAMNNPISNIDPTGLCDTNDPGSQCPDEPQPNVNDPCGSGGTGGCTGGGEPTQPNGRIVFPPFVFNSVSKDSWSDSAWGQIGEAGYYNQNMFGPGGFGAVPNGTSVPPNNNSWAWNFTKSFFGGFSLSTKTGTCLGVFTDTATAPLKQLQSAAKNYVPLIVGAMQAGPTGAAWYMSQLNNMVQSGAAEADPQVAAVVTTAGAAALTAAPYVSAAVPYAVTGGADLLLGYGLGAELKAGFNGQCRW